jgi:importin subunit beta-1
MTVGDLCRGLESKITPLVQAYVEELMNALRSPELLRTVKPFAIEVFGDIATSVGPAFQPFLEGVLLILNQAAETKVTEVS